jgi:hypothetical protein
VHHDREFLSAPGHPMYGSPITISNTRARSSSE